MESLRYLKCSVYRDFASQNFQVLIFIKLFFFLHDSFPVGSPCSLSQPTTSLSSSPPSVQPVTIQAHIQGLTSTSSLLATTASTTAQTITSHVQQVPVSVFVWLVGEKQTPCLFYYGTKSRFVYLYRVSSQVLLQPQFIKAESLLLTTLKHDPCIVTTVSSPTTLATTTTPVQSTSLQVGTSSAAGY